MKETWKSVTGYDGLYEVSNLGRIKRLERRRWVQCSCRRPYYALFPEKLMKPNNTKNNYVVQLVDKNHNKKYPSVSRLVAFEFVANPNNYEFVIHKDNNPLNNKANNLIWTSRKELEFKITKLVEKPIKCIETGEIFKNSVEAQKKTGFKASLLYQVCKGRYKQAYGLHWAYYTENAPK